MQRTKNIGIDALICIQGGGAKGGWQGGVLEELLRDTRINPKGVIGTSAGAINSLLISNKIIDRNKNIFEDFWLSISLKITKRFKLKLLLYSFKLCLKLFIYPIIDLLVTNNKIRWKSIISFNEFENIISSLLPADKSIRVNTYFYFTDIDSYERPNNNLRNIPVFEILPNEQIIFNNNTLSISKCIAISCCLPIICPENINGRYYSDGGLFSNIPIDILYKQGSLGCNCILIILSKPINDFKIQKDDIDYRSLKLLIDLKNIQTKELARYYKSRSNDTGDTYHSITFTPIFIIQPTIMPKSGIFMGFLFRKLMRKDYQQGCNQGKFIINAINELYTNSNYNQINTYLINNIFLPSLPSKTPKLNSFWIKFINKKWMKQ